MAVDPPAPTPVIGRRRHRRRTARVRLRQLLVIVGLLWAALLADPATASSWADLSPAQRRVLAQFDGQFDSLPAERRIKLARGAQRWLDMKTSERRAQQQRFARWQALPEARRRVLLQRFETFQRLTPAQQQVMRSTLQRFRSLPPEQRRELRRRFAALTPQERRAALRRFQQRQIEQHLRRQQRALRNDAEPGRDLPRDTQR